MEKPDQPHARYNKEPANQEVILRNTQVAKKQLGMLEIGALNGNSWH
jgi:hypothetical protein